MSTIQLIIISAIVGGSISLIILIGIFKRLAGLLLPPYPFYNLTKRSEKQEEVANYNGERRAYFTTIFIVLIAVWILSLDKPSDEFSIESRIPNIVVTGGNNLQDIPKATAKIGSVSNSEKNEKVQQYFVQLAVILDRHIAEETQRRFSAILGEKVQIIQKDGWHYIVIGPYEKREDAQIYAYKITDLNKSNSTIPP